MRVEGDGSELYEVLFPAGLVEQVLELLVAAWKVLESPADSDREPTITNRLVLVMQQECRRRRLRLRPMAHVKDFEGMESASGRGYVEIDMYIPYGYDVRCFFAVEAKKLNTVTAMGARSGNADEYVGPSGMRCFPDGRYGPNQMEGAMVGYVMDGRCDLAVEEIDKKLLEQASQLLLEPPKALARSALLKEVPHVYMTQHRLTRGQFVIYHVLLAA